METQYSASAPVPEAMVKFIVPAVLSQLVTPHTGVLSDSHTGIAVCEQLNGPTFSSLERVDGLRKQSKTKF